MDDMVAPRVCEGVIFLDRVVPGWETMLDLSTLDLASGERCVLGQIWMYKHRGSSDEGFGNMVNELELNNDEIVAYGFSTDGEDWDELTQEWKVTIANHVGSLMV